MVDASNVRDRLCMKNAIILGDPGPFSDNAVLKPDRQRSLSHRSYL